MYGVYEYLKALHGIYVYLETMYGNYVGKVFLETIL